MAYNRRSFIKTTTIFTFGGLAVPQLTNAKMKGILPKQGLKLSFEPYNLQLKHVFTLANSSRTTTPVMLTKIEFDGFTGYGEASMPPYLGETQKTAAKFLSGLNLEQFTDPFRMDEILEYVDNKAPQNNAAKASVDIALHDLVGKIIGQPWYKIWGFSSENTPVTSFTIGIDSREVVIEKVKEAAEFKILKVKLGRENDKNMIEAIRSVSDVPLCVDVNQGWKDKNMALDMIFWLKEKGIEFVEQPMPKELTNEIAWLTENSPLPIIADEAIQRLPDVKKTIGIYSGINIKLMKCTGMREAHKMVNLAHANQMKVMIGCMTETSCAVSAAAQLSPMAEWADLDGNLLISNDPYSGIKIVNGKVTLNNNPGIGISIS
ncbi:MAG: dipeptide epimerase [Prolixibacteraceae bacterium]|jgi:L-Ala-D/L-Glu epimerase|nr:dipeptide epimerase [Prolixibacteraceae bacterium]MBT6767253.1 dipeptide epimerase [Prolixibacteraceae bacterium]MBT6999629.1 dipeptide epimerase [Prolixibacteraceae bacterium]MBT7393435.1 dipeptide epimerase [Prolixibacteraceae bacterium]